MSSTPQARSRQWGAALGLILQSEEEEGGAGQEGAVLPRARHSAAAQAVSGEGWAAGERLYLPDFPTPWKSSPGGRTEAGDAR